MMGSVMTMADYPNPCDTCPREKECTHWCSLWQTRYLYRQNQMNAYARINGIVPGAPEYEAGVNPCDSCARSESCIAICKARARYWDERMALVRKEFGL